MRFRKNRIKEKLVCQTSKPTQLSMALTTTLTGSFKGKAKSDGEDIISPLIEQTAQAIVNAVAK